MFDQEFLKFLSTLGVGGVIAGLMFLVYRKDVKTFTDQWKGQSDMLMQVVKENSAAIASNTKTIEALHTREDRVQDWLEHLGLSSDRKGRKP
jgi:hypothetical protein